MNKQEIQALMQAESDRRREHDLRVKYAGTIATMIEKIKEARAELDLFYLSYQMTNDKRGIAEASDVIEIIDILDSVIDSNEKGEQ
jgi:hypothetical protein